MQDYTNGIVFGMDPVILRVGVVSLRWYALMIALGITAGLYLALREARRRALPDDVVYSGALWSILGGIVVARALHLLDKLDFYLQNPQLLASLAQGGMAVWGAVLGGALALVAYARVARLPALRLLDVATPGLLLGQIVGRVGSLVNGESWGTETSLPWGIVYTHPDARLPIESLGVPTHPYAVYEIAWNLVAFGLLWRLRTRWRLDGVLFASYLLLYSAGRFVLTYVREEGLFLFGLQQAQVIAAAVFLFALPFLVYLVTGQPGPSAEARAEEPAPAPPAR